MNRRRTAVFIGGTVRSAIPDDAFRLLTLPRGDRPVWAAPSRRRPQRRHGLAQGARCTGCSIALEEEGYLQREARRKVVLRGPQGAPPSSRSPRCRRCGRARTRLAVMRSLAKGHRRDLATSPSPTARRWLYSRPRRDGMAPAGAVFRRHPCAALLHGIRQDVPVDAQRPPAFRAFCGMWSSRRSRRTRSPTPTP